MANSDEPGKIEIGPEILNHLNTTRKWAMFLSIIGFIFLGLAILVGLIASTFLSTFNLGETIPEMPGYLQIIIILLIAVIYFLPGLFLFRFSKHTAHAIQTIDKQELNKAFRNLKSYFIYIGVLIIMVLTFYVVVLIVSGPSMALLKGLG